MKESEDPNPVPHSTKPNCERPGAKRVDTYPYNTLELLDNLHPRGRGKERGRRVHRPVYQVSVTILLNWCRKDTHAPTGE